MRNNLRVFTWSNSLMAFAFGLFGPFYYLFISEWGSIEDFGIAVGLVVLSGALVSWVAGRYSDRLGRKPFLIFGGYASAVIVFLYTIIGSLWQLYLLQVLNGLVVALFETAEGSFLGDITEKSSRGRDVGTYDAVLGVAEAAAIFAGGFLVSYFGFKAVFYAVSAIFVIATTWLLKLNED